MSGASRRVKNPLLSAAGEGFPFENYAENVLMPVTPATPAVLRDDAEPDNFVGQEAANQSSSNTNISSPAQINANIELQTIPLNTEEPKVSASQSSKQGYFTSILSSLPNLSLSSITGESSGSQANQESGTHNINPYGAPQDPRNSLRETSSLIDVNPYDPQPPNLSGSREVNFGSVAPPPTPPQPTVPPAVPLSSDGPVSYRLGNQRRLKYAPPPDLTSNATKTYPAPAVQTFFSPQGPLAPPSILNPNESVTPTPSHKPIEAQLPSSSPAAQFSTPEQLSQNSSCQGSFRSSPTIPGIPQNPVLTTQSFYSPNQSPYYESVPHPARPTISLSCSRPIPSHVQEPATPQNTPANVSFPGFDLYPSQRDPLGTAVSDKDAIVIKGTNQVTPTLSTLKDNTGSSEVNAAGFPITCTGTPFKPISAVKVSEKLEHILAERKELSPELSGEGLSKVDGNASSTENQNIETSTVSKEDKAEGNVGPVKEDSLTDVFLGQEDTRTTQLPVVSQELHVAQVASTESHAIASNVQSFQQYYQTQAPFVSDAGFPAEQQTQQKSCLNYPAPVPPPPLSVQSDTPKAFVQTQVEQKPSSNYPASVPPSTFSTHSDIPKPFVQTPSSYFQPVEAQPFAPFYPKETQPLIQPIPTISTVNLQNSPAFEKKPGSQTLWNTNPMRNAEVLGSTCSTTNQPPPPLFFNPTELQSEAYKHSPLKPKYVAPAETPLVTQANEYFGNLSQLHEPFELKGGNDTLFVPSSHPMTTVVPEPTGSATLSPVQMSANPHLARSPTDTLPPSFQNIASGSTEKRMQYRTVYHHWFYRKEVEHKVLWLPFSMQDSLSLEDAHNSSEISPETAVATDGGRYDVNILKRQRSSVYWTGPATEVRRCSWFYKGPTESRYVPYDEGTAAKLEEEYKQACVSNNWNRRIDLNNGEYIIFHSGTVQVHYSQASSPELAASWGNSAGAASRPRVIKRGLDEFHIEAGEPEKVDHLLFLVHGIGSVCDLKFRTVEEVVDEFRSISLQLVQSHYRTASEQRIVNRIEVLPISWHTTLHSEDTGIDKKLQAITLESIPKLRHFTNDTLLDILFYTSPIYCQTIMQTVGSELNRLYTLFRERNPEFDGGIYLGGHSLGSLILFDLLCHQNPPTEENVEETNNAEENEKGTEDENTGTIQPLPAPVLKRRLSKKISYMMGAAGTGQPYIHYPQINFHPRAFFALGSPIGMFVTVRGIDTLGENFALPTCPAFFNIFHPFDPVAYRVESLINPDAHKYRPMLIPHHKGRKRMHLELKETMARVGADLKQKLLDSVRSTWNSVYQLALFHKPDNQALEREIDKVVEEQLQKPPSVPEQQNTDDGGADFKVGNLNGGRRIDYVLQEAPFEYINEYIFALTSHVCYWESEDTMLLMLKEIYGSAGIQTDAQLPQQTLSIERIPVSPSPISSPCSNRSDAGSSVPGIGIDPTAPISEKLIGPPPMSGFVRKS